MSDIPVLVAVGQVTERLDDPGYRGLSPQDLAAEAARRALEDAGGSAALSSGAIDTLVAVRTTGDSMPEALRPFVAPFGGPDNFPGAIARRLGMAPPRLVYSPASGHMPQHLTREFCEEIAAGRCRAALLVGAEATATQRRAQAAGETLDWAEEVGGACEDRGTGIDYMRDAHLEQHGLGLPNTIYPLLEQARRGRLGMTPEAYRRAMGELFAGFSEVAESNPYAMAPRAMSAAAIASESERNRFVADPYLKAMVARDWVNQGAALVLTSERVAAELGIPREQWVYLHGAAEVVERPLPEREDLGASPAMAGAYRGALAAAGKTASELDHLDLYSCFPIAVFCACEALGLPVDDGRRLTVTGGLPYFGGPGNNYSMHAIASLAESLRADPGSFGLVGANGGFLSKHAIGVYSTAPLESWAPTDDAPLQATIDALPAPSFVTAPEGMGHVETYTVLYRGREAASAVIMGRLAETDARFVAVSEEPSCLRETVAGDVLGRAVSVRRDGDRNRFSYAVAAGAAAGS